MAKVSLILEDIEVNGKPGVRLSTAIDPTPDPDADPTIAEQYIAYFVDQVIDSAKQVNYIDSASAPKGDSDSTLN